MGQAWLGLGIYELPDAARLIGVSSVRLRLWVRGATALRDGERRELPPLWPTQLPNIEGRTGLGFLDLVQARMLLGFAKEGHSVRTLRLLIQHAQEVLGIDHPFAHARIKTDGRRLYLEVLSKEGEAQVYDLGRRQYAFHRIISPTFRQLDFSMEMAVRWWPLGKDRTVVLDPNRSFGAPIAKESGVPTATLFDELVRLGSIRNVARWFEVSRREVVDAVEFERHLRPSPKTVPAAA